MLIPLYGPGVVLSATMHAVQVSILIHLLVIGFLACIINVDITPFPASLGDIRS